MTGETGSTGWTSEAEAATERSEGATQRSDTDPNTPYRRPCPRSERSEQWARPEAAFFYPGDGRDGFNRVDQATG